MTNFIPFADDAATMSIVKLPQRRHRSDLLYGSLDLTGTGRG